MTPTTTASSNRFFHNLSSPPPRNHLPLPQQTPRFLFPFSSTTTGAKKLTSQRLAHLPRGTIGRQVSAWDDKPFEVLPNGERLYLDEEDVLSFLDPPQELIPLDPVSYNPASYLWKKIEDIPKERRHRLLALINPQLILKAWKIAGARYKDPKFSKRIANKFLSFEDHEVALEFYDCRSSGGKWPIGWIRSFRKAIFHGNDGNTYGRFIDGSMLSRIANAVSPLYFSVRDYTEIMSTEQPCDLAYEFGDGCLNLQNYPQSFPKPAEHPYPFNDQVVVYIRHIGPGVLVGQAWQEGKELQQVPRKLCCEILMIKDYAASREH